MTQNPSMQMSDPRAQKDLVITFAVLYDRFPESAEKRLSSSRGPRRPTVLKRAYTPEGAPHTAFITLNLGHPFAQSSTPCALVVTEAAPQKFCILLVPGHRRGSQA